MSINITEKNSVRNLRRVTVTTTAIKKVAFGRTVSSAQKKLRRNEEISPKQKPKYKKYERVDVAMALEALNDEGMSLNEANKRFAIPKETLRRLKNSKVAPVDILIRSRTKSTYLTLDELKSVGQLIIKQKEEHDSITVSQMTDFISQVVSESAKQRGSDQFPRTPSRRWVRTTLPKLLEELGIEVKVQKPRAGTRSTMAPEDTELAVAKFLELYNEQLEILKTIYKDREEMALRI